MSKLTQVYIIASDGYVFNMEMMDDHQIRKVIEWTLGDSDEIRGFKRLSSPAGKQLILKIPGTEYNENTFEFFNQLWLEREGNK